MAVTKLYKEKKVKHIVSQNCDGLHVRSGIPCHVLSELHGNMFLEICTKCNPQREYLRLFDVTEKTGVRKHKTRRYCHRCKAELRDTIVHFGEKSPNKSSPYNWEEAADAADDADVILCLGSSLKVLKKYTCLWHTHLPAAQRPALFVVNLMWTPKDESATLKINGKCDTVMRLVMESLELKVDPYDKSEDPIFKLATALKEPELKTTTKKILVKPDVKKIENISEDKKEPGESENVVKHETSDNSSPLPVAETKVKIESSSNDSSMQVAKTESILPSDITMSSTKTETILSSVQVSSVKCEPIERKLVSVGTDPLSSHSLVNATSTQLSHGSLPFPTMVFSSSAFPLLPQVPIMNHQLPISGVSLSGISMIADAPPCLSKVGTAVKRTMSAEESSSSPVTAKKCPTIKELLKQPPLLSKDPLMSVVPSVEQTKGKLQSSKTVIPQPCPPVLLNSSFDSLVSSIAANAAHSVCLNSVKPNCVQSSSNPTYPAINQNEDLTQPNRPPQVFNTHIGEPVNPKLLFFTKINEPTSEQQNISVSLPTATGASTSPNSSKITLSTLISESKSQVKSVTVPQGAPLSLLPNVPMNQVFLENKLNDAQLRLGKEAVKSPSRPAQNRNNGTEVAKVENQDASLQGLTILNQTLIGMQNTMAKIASLERNGQKFSQTLSIPQLQQSIKPNQRAPTHVTQVLPSSNQNKNTNDIIRQANAGVQLDNLPQISASPSSTVQNNYLNQVAAQTSVAQGITTSQICSMTVMPMIKTESLSETQIKSQIDIKTSDDVLDCAGNGQQNDDGYHPAKGEPGISLDPITSIENPTVRLLQNQEDADTDSTLSEGTGDSESPVSTPTDSSVSAPGWFGKGLNIKKTKRKRLK